MHIKITDGRIKFSSLFKLTALGYLLGAALLFVPFFLITTVLSVASAYIGIPVSMNGYPATGGLAMAAAFTPMLILPVVLAFQATVFGVIAALGLWLYNRKRPIQVVTE